MAQILTLLIVLSCIVSVDAAPIIPLETFFRNAEVEHAQLSPDGNWISYRKPYKNRMNIFIRRPGSKAEHRLTNEEVRPIVDYKWSFDSKWILYLQDEKGDENFHLFSVPVSAEGTPNPRDLTPFKGVTVELLLLSLTSPDLVLVTMNKRDPSLMDAYWLNLKTRELKLAAENPGNFTAYLADNKNQVRVASAISEKGETLIFARASETAKWNLVKTYSTTDIASLLRFHPDGKRIYLKASGSQKASDLAGLILLDIQNGQETVLEVDPEGESDLVDAIFSDKTQDLLVTIYEGDKRRIYARTKRMQEDLEEWKRVRPGNIRVIASTLDEDRWIISFDAPNVPPATYLYSRKQKKTELLFESLPWLKAEELSEMRPIQYKSRDGLLIRGYLTIPAGSGKSRLPTVLLVHGGPWERDRWEFQSVVQLLANRGYAVLQINYRGSTGFGKRFAFAAKKEFAGAMHNDLIDGVQWAIDRGISDPNKIGIMGISYGGYATLVGLTFTPDEFACGADFAGPASLITLIESFPPYWKPYLARRWYPMVGNPSNESDREDMKKRSPLYFADRLKKPLMIYQGVNDPRVKKAQADQMAIALRERGVTVKYLLAQDEGHGLDNPENELAVFRVTELFFQDCLGGRSQSSVPEAVEAQIKAMTVNVNELKKE